MELTEWRAYYGLEPFGELVADQRHGIATSVLANVNRDAKRHPEPYQAADFVYWHESHRSEAHDGALSMLDAEQHSRLIKRTLFRSE